MLSATNIHQLTLTSERMVLPLWRSLASLNLMLPKEDRKAMLLRLYNDESPLEDHSKDRFKSNVTDSKVEVGSFVEEDGSLDGDVKQQEDDDMNDEEATEDTSAVPSDIVHKIAAVDDELEGPPGNGDEDIVGVSGLETKEGEDLAMRDSSGPSVEEQAEKEVRVAVGLED